MAGITYTAVALVALLALFIIPAGLRQLADTDAFADYASAYGTFLAGLGIGLLFAEALDGPRTPTAWTPYVAVGLAAAFIGAIVNVGATDIFPPTWQNIVLGIVLVAGGFGLALVPLAVKKARHT